MLTGSDESATAVRAWMAQVEPPPHPLLPSASIHVLRFQAGSDAAVVAPALLGLREEMTGDEAPPLILVHDLVDASGLIRQGALQEVLLARDLLGPRALVPHAFRVMVQCLEAPGLLLQNRLDPANTLGMKLEALDGLGVTTFRELDLAAAIRVETCAPLSHPCAALPVDLRAVRVGGGGGGQGEEEEIVARARVSIPVTASGTLHAVGFWFELQLAEGSGGPVLSTGVGAVGEEEGENGGCSSYRQGAVLLGEARVVQPGETVSVEAVCTLSRGIDLFVVGPG